MDDLELEEGQNDEEEIVFEKPLKRNGRKPVTTRERLDERDDQDLWAYVSGLGAGAQFKVKLQRLDPKTFKGKQVAGHIDTFDELITDDEIKQRFGGGKYQLSVMRRNERGSYVFGTSRMLQIAGDPVIDVSDESKPQLPAADINKDILNQIMEEARAAREEKAQLEKELRESMSQQNQRPALDPILMELIIAPLREQLAAAQRALEEARKTPTTQPASEKLLERMVDGESARIMALREQHQSELRQVREAGREDLKRESDRADRMLQSLREANAREVDTIKMTFQSSLENQKVAYEGRIANLTSDVSRLTAELAETRKELKELRSEKEKPIQEQILAFAQLKDAMEEITGGSGSDGEDKGMFDKLVENAGPIIEAVGARLAGAQAGGIPPEHLAMLAQQQQQQQMALAHQQRQQVAIVRQQQKVKKKKPKPSAIKVDPNNVNMAVGFLESAFNSGQDPATVAQSIVSMAPSDVIAKIREVGIDTFLDENATIAANSSLSTQAGRNFLRAITKALLGEAPTLSELLPDLPPELP